MAVVDEPALDMSLDSDDEWLQEPFAPAPPKRRKLSDEASSDDIEASQFLDELLNSYKSTLPALPVVRHSLPAAALPVLPAPLARPALRVDRFIAASAGDRSRPQCPNANRRPQQAAVPKPQQAAAPKRRAEPQQADVPKVNFRLPHSSNAGNILLHATQLVQDIIGKGPTVFKIGITADPAHRWGNVRYGYQHDKDRYQQMLVMSEADSAGAAMLEASLISLFKQTSGCRNCAPGGESVRQGCLIFTYIVYRHLDTAIGMEPARLHRAGG